MSEAAPEGGNETGATPAGSEFKPITSQDDLNKVINDRLTRERAKFADYKDLQAKASKLDEIEQASKSELEKVAERATAAEKERDAALAASLRWKVAAAHGISTKPGEGGEPSDADLFLTGSDEDTLNAQALRLLGREADRKKNGNHVPNEGTAPKPEEGSESAFARALFKGD